MTVSLDRLVRLLEARRLPSLADVVRVTGGRDDQFHLFLWLVHFHEAGNDSWLGGRRQKAWTRTLVGHGTAAVSELLRAVHLGLHLRAESGLGECVVPTVLQALAKRTRGRRVLEQGAADEGNALAVRVAAIRALQTRREPPVETLRVVQDVIRGADKELRRAIIWTSRETLHNVWKLHVGLALLETADWRVGKDMLHGSMRRVLEESAELARRSIDETRRRLGGRRVRRLNQAIEDALGADAVIRISTIPT